MQKRAWEREYDRASLVSRGSEPSQAVKDFLKWLRRDQKIDIYSMNVLDAGCGVGKNSLYLADLGNIVTGVDFAENAIHEAQVRAGKGTTNVTFLVGDLGNKLPLADASQDVILDVMTSNSLTVEARNTFILESARVLKKGGFYMLRTLAKEGDKNAKNLIATVPGSTPDSYILPEVGIEESVFLKDTIAILYKDNFQMAHSERKTGYQTIANRTFKRNYWVIYLRRI